MSKDNVSAKLLATEFDWITLIGRDGITEEDIMGLIGEITGLMRLLQGLIRLLQGLIMLLQGLQGLMGAMMGPLQPQSGAMRIYWAKEVCKKKKKT